ncbi:MAG: nucleoside-diphosphate sugar epimerase/dehydratase [Bacteroidetes bacterium]|nr:nucleoside-diphosphate sugar epimerase/dehydratase [Bacteroidota bacterium]
MKLIKKILSKSYAPSWLILQIDLVFVAFSVVLAYLLRFNFNIDKQEFSGLLPNIFAFVSVRLVLFYFTKTYHGVVRYTSTQDAKRIFISLTAGTMIISAANAAYYYNNLTEFVPFSIIIGEYFATALMMSSFRLFVKIIYSEIKTFDVEKKNVVIYGAGESGLITKRTIDHDKESRKKIICFFDDDQKKSDKSLEGVKIYNFDDDFDHIISKYKIDELIIAIQDNMSRKRKEEIVDRCIKNHIHVKIVPSANSWINGGFSAQQIKDVNIEDLLERDPIQLNQEEILIQLSDKTILVTGASGSIGSELVRQIIRFYPKQIILVDQAETPLYELELELKEQSSYINMIAVIADVTNKRKMEQIISKYKPEIIYHAAAYKHVPLMEDNPIEAVVTNIQGTKNMADLAIKHHVKKFVFISTDKAVNPTNVMGASKRIAEIYVQSLNGYLRNTKSGVTSFITTRFGNVLGSNGSVIPRFRRQIEAGGPVTVTHPEICRYFMTIPEASQLILEAGMMGKGGEIYVFDMGEPVKIVDLAKKMIHLSGFKAGHDIQITFTGLRPGEKIKEELLNNKEKTLPTHHAKIMIGKVREYPFEMVYREITELLEMAETENETRVVAKMKVVVPEFISNNSVFEELDKMSLSSELNFNQSYSDK